MSKLTFALILGLMFINSSAHAVALVPNEKCRAQSGLQIEIRGKDNRVAEVTMIYPNGQKLSGDAAFSWGISSNHYVFDNGRIDVGTESALYVDGQKPMPLQCQL